MRLRAGVTKAIGESTNYIGTIKDGTPVPVEKLPIPVWLEISEQDGAFFLLYMSSDTECFADTWHQTLESAKREAMLGFAVKPEDWEKV